MSFMIISAESSDAIDDILAEFVTDDYHATFKFSLIGQKEVHVLLTGKRYILDRITEKMRPLTYDI